METFLTTLPAILSGISAILVAWFGYNQYTKNKQTDFKIEKYKSDHEAMAKRRSDNSSTVYGELWTVLNELGADRVYIIQAYPLGNEEYLSVYYEVKRKGLQGMRDRIHDIKIAEVPVFNRTLVENEFMYITDLKDVRDDYMHSLLSSYGCSAAIIRRLSDNRYDRIGSVVCEFSRPILIADEETAREVLNTAAANVQYILPPYVD